MEINNSVIIILPFNRPKKWSALLELGQRRQLSFVGYEQAHGQGEDDEEKDKTEAVIIKHSMTEH